MNKAILYYELRIAFGFASLLPLLLLPGYAILGWIAWASRGATPSLQEGIRAFEVLLTLSGGLAAAHLMTIEREEGFDEIRRTYTELSWRIPLLRTFTALISIAISGFIAAGIFYLAHGAYDLGQLLLPAFAPAFYLCALAMLVNNISGSYWISSGIIAAYWFGELSSGGNYTEALYLFNHSTPRPDLDPLLNRGLLLIAMLIAIMLNIAFSMWRRRTSGGR